MRAIAILVCTLLLFCQGARAEKPEPFGAQFHTRSDNWAFDLQMRFLDEKKDRGVISAIAEEVRQKPKEYWLTWVNQLVNLSVKLAGSSKEGICARSAVAKFEVLRQLGFPREDLRLVYGIASEEHAVAAVWSPDGWLILDNGALVVGFKPVLESKVRGFKAERSFY